MEGVEGGKGMWRGLRVVVEGGEGVLEGDRRVIETTLALLNSTHCSPPPIPG